MNSNKTKHNNQPGIGDTFSTPVKSLLDISRHSSVSERLADKDYFYFAAGLFNNEQLAGNCILGGEILRISEGLFVPDLPQNKESSTDIRDRHPFNIRAKDLKGVLQADLALFMFENVSLDEGMLIELGFAKALGVPTIVIRTDFRKAGDQEGNELENWNLMCSDWPMHRVITSCSIAEYNKCLSEPGANLLTILSGLYSPLATKAVEAFTELRKLPPVISGNKEFVHNYFRQVIKTYDGSSRLAEIIGDEEIDKAVSRKIKKGLITIVE